MADPEFLNFKEPRNQFQGDDFATKAGGIDSCAPKKLKNSGSGRNHLNDKITLSLPLG
jgi:hypothetical protein